MVSVETAPSNLKVVAKSNRNSSMGAIVPVLHLASSRNNVVFLTTFVHNL